MNFDLNVAHVADVNMSALIDMADPTGANKSVIKVNHNVFNVSVSEGRVNVSFNGGRFNSFRQATLNRLQTSLQEQYDRFLATYGNVTRVREEYGHESPATDVVKGNTLFALQDRYLDSEQPAREARADGAQIAIYGFSDVRNHVAEQLTTRDVHYTTIDSYNSQCNILWNEVTAEKLPKLIDNIRNKTLSIKVSDNYYKESDLHAWADFLSQNVAKVDIFAKIRSYLAVDPQADKGATGWKGEFARKGFDVAMGELVRKNIPGEDRTICNGLHDINDADIKIIGNALAEIARRNCAVTDDEIVGIIKDQFNTGAVAYPADQPVTMKLLNELARVCSTTIRNMFFRQTSKLGLDFFAKQGIPVMFQWSNHKGVSLENHEKTIENRWWKNPGDSIHDHYGATITFSEMRHVKKMEQSQANLDLIKVNGIRI